MAEEGYQKLEIYQLSRSLAIRVHQMTLKLPGFEMHEEGAQIRRSSKSVVSNIVEGYSLRKHKNEFLQYLHRSFASSEETFQHLDFLRATDSLLDEPTFTELVSSYTQLSKMIFRFIQSVAESHTTPFYVKEESPDLGASSTSNPQPPILNPDSSDLYLRNINVAVARKDDRHIVTTATMLDLNHHISVELTIGLEEETIVDARAQMTKVPYAVCQLTLGNIRRLVGMKIERGIHRRLVETLGHAEGCTHMVDLAMEAVRLSANVMIGLTKVGPKWFDRGELTEQEMIEEVRPILRNTCLPFKDEQ